MNIDYIGLQPDSGLVEKGAIMDSTAASLYDSVNFVLHPADQYTDSNL